MTDEETKLVREQLVEAYKFQDNTEAFWVHQIANRLVDDIKNILRDNPDNNELGVAEGNIQFTCDIFAGFHKNRYKHEDYYHLVLAKYDENQEPFNHAWKIHRLMDLINSELISEYEKSK